MSANTAAQRLVRCKSAFGRLPLRGRGRAGEAYLKPHR